MERVITGGLKQFVYPKGYTPPRDLEQEEEIDKAWEKVRKRRLRNKIIKWSLLIVVLVFGLYYILK